MTSLCARGNVGVGAAYNGKDSVANFYPINQRSTPVASVSASFATVQSVPAPMSPSQVKTNSPQLASIGGNTSHSSIHLDGSLLDAKELNGEVDLFVSYEFSLKSPNAEKNMTYKIKNPLEVFGKRVEGTGSVKPSRVGDLSRVVLKEISINKMYSDAPLGFHVLINKVEGTVTDSTGQRSSYNISPKESWVGMDGKGVTVYSMPLDLKDLNWDMHGITMESLNQWVTPLNKTSTDESSNDCLVSDRSPILRVLDNDENRSLLGIKLSDIKITNGHFFLDARAVDECHKAIIAHSQGDKYFVNLNEFEVSLIRDDGRQLDDVEGLCGVFPDGGISDLLLQKNNTIKFNLKVKYAIVDSSIQPGLFSSYHPNK